MTSRVAGFCLATAVCLMLSPVCINAAEFRSVEVGFQRQAQVGVWMPIRVAAEGLSPGKSVSLAFTSQDPRGNPIVRICETEVVDQDGHVALTGQGRTGRLDDVLQIDLIEKDNPTPVCSCVIRCSERPLNQAAGNVQRFLRVFRQNVKFLLTIQQPAGIDELLIQAAEISPDAPIIVGASIDSDDELPTDSQAYDLFSTIVLTGNIELNEQQFLALKTWIHAGGRLIVSCGDQLPDLLTTPLGQWLDARFDISAETRPVTDVDLGALQQIVPRSTRISTNRRRVNMAQVRSKQPVWLAESSNGSLVSRIGCGGGQVTLVSLDLGTKPLSDWNSLKDFYAILILGAPLRKATGHNNSSRISSSGISDLTTQLMATIDPIPRSGRWTTWSVMALAFAWLLLIGPVDYFVVVVLLKRPHLTWITFPVWVVIGFATLYSLKTDASHVVLNSVHLVDVAQDGDDHSMHALSLLSLSAPHTSRTELKAIPESVFCTTEPSVALTWAGRPEDVYGGMYRTTGIGGRSQPYSCNADTPETLTSVPLLADGSFESQARWNAESKTPLLESNLHVSGFGILSGEFQHQLPVAIHDWFAVYGNRLYRARDDARKSLAAGQTWKFELGSAQISDIKTWLVGRREIKNPPSRKLSERSGVLVPYNSRGRDALDIVTMMSLHHTAGADVYTGLSHHPLQRLDASEAIRLNYAVVIGWIQEPATTIEMGGTRLHESSSITIVRLLLPVDRRPARPTALSGQELDDAKRHQQESGGDSSLVTPNTDTPSADESR